MEIRKYQKSTKLLVEVAEGMVTVVVVVVEFLAVKVKEMVVVMEIIRPFAL